MMRLLSRPRDERGAVAILVAALTIVLFGIAALSVDIASQVQRKHLLKNQLDAAATAAAFYLDQDTNGIRDAVTNAKAYFIKNGEGTLDDAKIDFWCVVARKLNTDGTPATPPQVASYQIPSATSTAGVCNPDAKTSTLATWYQSDYQDRARYDGQLFDMTCNDTLCAVPCALNAKSANNWQPGNSLLNGAPITCNTIRVGAEQNVPFSFAPAIGYDEGSTGAQIAVACKGSCGSIAPNPMNVVVITDRTTSMEEDDLHDLISGVKDMLGVMSPDVQFVSLGTIGKSDTTTRASYTTCTSSTGTMVGLTDTLSTSRNIAQTTKLWVPLKFYKDYQTSTGALNTNSSLVKALTCLDPNSSPHVGQTGGTYLAAPLKSAARYVLGLDSTSWNVNSELNGLARSGAIRNVVIFETDGQPDEVAQTAATGCGVTNSLTSTATGCGNGYDVVSDSRVNTVTGPTTTTTTGTLSTGCATGTIPYTGGTSCQSVYNQTETCSGTYTLGTSGSFDGNCWSQVTTYTSNFSCTNAGYRWGNPTGGTTNRCWRDRGAATVSGGYLIGYMKKADTATTVTTTTYTGGQTACQNFVNVANTFKNNNPNNLVITVGYNLDNSTLCGGNNRYSSGYKVGSGSSNTTSTSTGPYLSGVLNSSGNQITSSTCVSGGGVSTNPYVFKSTCTQNVTLIYTTLTTYTTTNVAQGINNDPVPDILAEAAGGQGIDASTNSADCSVAANRATENTDGDFFFCAASGDDMGPIFITALSQVSSGIKLMNLP